MNKVVCVCVLEYTCINQTFYAMHLSVFAIKLPTVPCELLAETYMLHFVPGTQLRQGIVGKLVEKTSE